MNKLCDALLKQKTAFVSFILGCFGMLVILQCNGVLFGASHALLYGDSFEIYVPAIKNLCRDILNHESIYYSWNTALGMNTSLYNAFYAASPFNIIYLIFFNADENIVTAVVVVLKTGLAAFCFNMFVREAYNVKGVYSILFALSYSLCAYQISFNIINIIWLDAMFVLPMVFLNIIRLCKTERYFGLFFWYSFIFISQFYMGYMIGIISFLFFVLCLLFCESPNRILLVKDWVISVLGAVGVSAFLWLPALYFIINNRASDSTNNAITPKNFLDVFRQLFWGNNSMLYEDVPNLYCGLVAVLFFFLFLIIKEIKTTDKITYLILFAFMAASCLSGKLYMFFHGFDNPDGWYYRFSFIFCFLLCTIGAIASEHISKSNVLYIVWAIIAVILLFVGTEVWNYAHNRELYRGDTLRIGVNLLCAIIWGVALIRYEMSDRIGHMVWGIAIIFGVMIELGSSGMRVDFRGRTIELYNVWKESFYSNPREISEDGDFYRINSLYDMCCNSGTFWGYNGIAYFASPENPNARMEMRRLGFYTSPRLFFNYGLTPVTEMIFDVKYDMYNGIEEVIDTEKSLKDCAGRVEINDEVLNLGYMVSGNLNDYDYSGNNAFENNNYLLSTMTGMNIRAFDSVQPEMVTCYGTGISVVPEETGYWIHREKEADENSEFYITVSNDEDKSRYIYVYSENSKKITGNDYFVMEGGYENTISKFGDIRIPYIKEMEKKDAANYVRISPQGDVTDARFDDVYIYELNADELHKAYDDLQREQIRIKELKDGYIEAHVDVNGDKHILFTSIPYDKGWAVRVNGDKAETVPILNDAFIAVELPNKGDYELEFEFHALGSREGAVITAASLVIMIALMFLDKYGTRQKAEQNG